MIVKKTSAAIGAGGEPETRGEDRDVGENVGEGAAGGSSLGCRWRGRGCDKDAWA